VTRRLLTTAEAGRLLGLSPVSVRSAIRRGTLRAEKVGRDWLVDETDLRWYQVRTERVENRKSART
jgi:excisionase family DNA binding protein